MSQILLYYKYIPIADPDALAKEQRELCEYLDLKGRIIVASEGINGTVEGSEENTNKYKEALLADPRFADMNIKVSVGNGEAFPKLSVKVRSEIVSAHLGEDDVKPWEMTGTYLSAEELDSWINSGKEFVIVDMRNDYEYRIGHFENSINMGMKNFRDLPQVISKIENLKENPDLPIVPVCTGGVRCEKASGYLMKKGFKNVYQLENGIVTYMEKFPGKAFKGKLYVFDSRVAMDFDTPENHTVIGRCDLCEAPTERYVNCRNKECNAHFLVCMACEEEQGIFCSEKCKTLVAV